MQSTSLAPELSATRRRDSCWIIGPSPAPLPPATASAGRAGASRPPAPGPRGAGRCPRRGRRASWSAGPSSRTWDGGPAPPPRPRRSCPSCPRSPPLRGPFAGSAAGWPGSPGTRAPGPHLRCQWQRSRRCRSSLPFSSCPWCRSRLGAGHHGPPRRDLPLPLDGHYACDLPAYLAQAGLVVQLARHGLEAEVEQLLTGVGQLGLQLLVIGHSQLGGLGHQASTSTASASALV